MPIQVRTAHRTDIPALARTLARAFGDDPVFCWLQPDPAKRTAALPGFFGAMARHHFLPGGGVEVALSGDGVGAAAMWDPPGRPAEQARELIGVLPAVIRTFGSRIRVAWALSEEMKAHHPEEPHWYLGMIGSDPSVRGGGYGAVLMRSGLDRCDAEAAPAYLESSNPDNIGYYMRFGFEVTGEIAMPGGGPSLWPMWRPPAIPARFSSLGDD
jgi:ribosomal protein S18 acetylase RimI-like enzyme